MKKLTHLFAALVLAFCLAVLPGCTLIEFSAGANQAQDSAALVGDTADQVLTAAEQIAGHNLISSDTAEKGEAAAGKVATLATVGQKGAQVAANFLPEEYQPYASVANAALGALSALSLAAAGVFAKRKQKAQTALTAVIVGANDLPQAGAAISQAAKNYGAADAVESAYKDAVTSGDISIKKSA